MEKELFGGRPWHLPETTKDVFLLSGVQAWPSVHHALGSGSYFNLRSAQAKGYGLTNRVVPTVWLAHLTTEEFWSTQMARYGPPLHCRSPRCSCRSSLGGSGGWPSGRSGLSTWPPSSIQCSAEWRGNWTGGSASGAGFGRGKLPRLPTLLTWR